jgi:hypothetical protein
MKISIPNKYIDSDEILSDMHRKQMFAYAVIASVNSLDFSKSSIERRSRKSQKSVTKIAKTLTGKQISLIAWVYVLNMYGYNTFDTDELNKNISDFLGFKFVENHRDLSVWLCELNRVVTRDKYSKKTDINGSIRSLLDLAFQNGFIELKIEI